MITCPVCFGIGYLHLITRVLLRPGYRFQHGNTVIATATDIVNLTGPRIIKECMGGTNYIKTVNLVSYLLTLISEDSIRPAMLTAFE